MRYRVPHRSAATQAGLTPVLDAQERSQVKSRLKKDRAECASPLNRIAWAKTSVLLAFQGKPL